MSVPVLEKTAITEVYSSISIPESCLVAYTDEIKTRYSSIETTPMPGGVAALLDSCDFDGWPALSESRPGASLGNFRVVRAVTCLFHRCTVSRGSTKLKAFARSHYARGEV